MSAASMAALNTSFAGQRLNKAAARKVSAKVTTRAVNPVTRAQAVAAPADDDGPVPMDTDEQAPPAAAKKLTFKFSMKAKE